MSIGIYKQKAKNIMTPHVDVIHCEETVRDALTLFARHNVASLPVVDSEDRCIGIISQSDLIAITHSADEERDFQFCSNPTVLGGIPLDQLTREKIEDVMTDRVATVTPEHEVVDVADLMLNHGIHHVPVCDETGKLCGIISAMDILAGLRCRAADCG